MPQESGVASVTTQTRTQQRPAAKRDGMCDESQQRIAFDTDECASTAVHAHAKQELSEKLNASILLELQQAGGGPLFPCESVVQPQDVAVH